MRPHSTLLHPSVELFPLTSLLHLREELFPLTTLLQLLVELLPLTISLFLFIISHMSFYHESYHYELFRGLRCGYLLPFHQN